MKKRRPELAATAAHPVLPPAWPWQVARPLSQAAPILLVIGTWLLLRPYRGIVHDARLYAAQALRELDPGSYDRDLFFAFGSQDQFTLFTRFYAPLIDGIGLPAAALAVVVGGQILWMSGAAALAMRLAGRGAALFAGLLLLAALPSTYGGWQTFAFGESFATPRLLAEGLGLWALWALTHRRCALALVLTVASGLLHPIMCATVLLAGWIFLVLRDPRWVALAAAGLLAAAAGILAGIAPLDRALATMDAEWLAVVEPRNTYLFPAQWRQGDWGRFAVTLAMALAGATLLSGWRRSLVLAVAAAAALGVGITCIGADILHNLLAIQLQLYRAMWLVGVVGWLCAGLLLVRIWALAEDGSALVALLAFGVFVTFTLLPGAGVGLVVAGLLIALLRLHGRLGPLPGLLQAASVSAAALLGLGLLAFRAVSLRDRLEVAATSGMPASVLATVTVVDMAVIAVAVLMLVRIWPAAAARALPAVALAVLAGSLLAWDRRDAGSPEMLTQPNFLPAAWSLPSDTQVFWENDAGGPWFVLRRPSYVSTTQGAGISFNRDTAMAFKRRVDVVQPLLQLEMVDIYRQERAVHGALPSLNRPDLVAACGRDAGLGALVLSRAVEGSYSAVWELPEPRYNNWLATRGMPQTPVTRYYLYRCSDLRTPMAADRG